jgi:hypothetical protein
VKAEAEEGQKAQGCSRVIFVKIPITNPVWADAFFLVLLTVALGLIFRTGRSSGWSFQPWKQRVIGAIGSLILLSLLLDLWYRLTGRGHFLN